MKHITIVLIMAVFVLAPVTAMAVDEKDFEVKTTRELINLCTAPLEDPLHTPAVNFCHGCARRTSTGMHVRSKAYAQRDHRHVHRLGQRSPSVHE